MERRKYELFAQFVRRLPMRTQKWYAVQTRVCFAMEISLSSASANPGISYPIFVYFKIGFAQLGV